MSPDLPSQPPTPLKNRRGWLIAFGVIEILIAGFCLLLLALMVAGLLALSHANRPAGAPELSAAGPVIAVLVYGGLGVLFLILGVGSIRRKNWARIATQIVSGFWLFTGVLSSLFFVFVLPNFMEQQGKLPPEQRRHVFIMLGLFAVVVMVLLPATLLVFYSLKSVRATCQGSGLGQGPTMASTEHAVSPPPVSVILLALWECLGALAVLSLLMVRANVVFGIVVRGPGAILLMTAHAVLSGIAAWLLYRRDYLGWAISLFKSLFWAASWVVTLLTRDIMDIYREMGFNEQQLQVFRQLPHLQSVGFVLSMSGFAIYWILILYTKKFFSRAGTGAGVRSGESEKNGEW
jgi:hypothetical protein